MIFILFLLLQVNPAVVDQHNRVTNMLVAQEKKVWESWSRKYVPKLREVQMLYDPDQLVAPGLKREALREFYKIHREMVKYCEILEEVNKLRNLLEDQVGAERTTLRTCETVEPVPDA